MTLDRYKSTLVAFVLAMISALSASAETTIEKIERELDNVFYTSNKAYVVVTVLVIVFLGIISYLVKLDRKVTRLENKK